MTAPSRRGRSPAGVAITPARYDGITHDFMLLDALSQSHATRLDLVFRLTDS